MLFSFHLFYRLIVQGLSVDPQLNRHFIVINFNSGTPFINGFEGFEEKFKTGKIPWFIHATSFFWFRAEDDFLRNITTLKYSVKKTAMRANKLYYKIYFIGLNTFFGSILPMFILIYLNTSTIVALYKMGHSPDAAGGDLTNGQQPLRPLRPFPNPKSNPLQRSFHKENK